MKRYGNLYPKIWDIDNIRLAHKNARKGKTHYKEVKEVDANEDYYCQLISDMLKNNEFVNSEYEVFTKQDKNKERVIHKLPYFPDRIVHHAILQVLEPIWKKTFIANTYQSILGRGVHKAKKDVRKAINSMDDEVYYLQMDIEKFYPSIDNDKMYEIVQRKVKCKGTLNLLHSIIYSLKGLAIGNYISQYLGNLYLTYFDHYVKEVLGVKHYFRYCDDIVILSNNIEDLVKYKEAITEKLNNQYNLKIKDKTYLEPINKGLDFLGFVFYKRYTLLRSSIAKGFKQAVKRFILTKQSRDLFSIISYNGWLISVDAYNLWTRYVSSKLKLKAKELGYNGRTIRGVL